jgi:uncharacterized membrane protein required for colicin V production
VGTPLAALDTTWGQVTADLLLVILVLVNLYLGWRHGTVRRVFAFGGVYLAAFAATNVGNAIAGLLQQHSLYANAWSFVGVFVIVLVTVEIIGQVLHDRLQLVAVVMFDRIVGAVGGAIVGLAEALILFLVALAMAGVHGAGADPTRSAAANAIRSSTLSGQAVRLEPQVQFVFKPALPGDFSGHLAQSLVVATPPT